MRRSAALLALVLLAAGSGSCRRAGPPAPIPLDGTARNPDVSGVVEQVSSTSITIDGRTFAVSRRLQCFATASLETVPLVGRLHHFVHAGLDGRTVVWLAGFGPVAEPPGSPATVFYVGTAAGRVGSDHLRFRDGTVLPFEPGIEPPVAGTRVRADIEPSTGRVRAYTVVGFTASSR